MVRDAAVWLFGLVVVLALAQVVVDGEVARTAAGAAPYVAGLVVVVGATPLVRRLDDRATVRVVAYAGVGLAVWLVVAFAAALPAGLGEPSGFYRVKQAVTSPVGDHNTAAGLLLVGVVATAVLAAGDRRWHAGVAVTTLGVAATLSRGAAVVLLAAGGVAVLAGVRRAVAGRVAVAAAAALGLVLLAGLVLDASPPPDGPTSDGPVGASVAARADLWARGAELGTAAPLLGVGLGGFAAHAGDLLPPNDHAHNLLLHAVAEGGIGLAAIAVVLPLVLLRRAWRRGPDARRELVLLGGVALVAHAQLDILSGRFGYEVLLAFLLAVAAAGDPAVAAIGAGAERGSPPPRR